MSKGATMTRGGRRPGAGRPKKGPEDVASVYVPIHMTEAERELCQEAADAAKADAVSSWGKTVLLAAARKKLGRK